jgi:hypothetical protein
MIDPVPTRLGPWAAEAVPNAVHYQYRNRSTLMPLHDWTDLAGWEGMHIFWMTEIARALRAELPKGFRAVIGSSPLVVVGATPVKPDVAVTNGPPRPSQDSNTPDSIPQPDMEVAVATLEEDLAVEVEHDGRLVAVVELVSPRNKDRPGAREQYAARYLSYLRAGVHLLLVDVHRRPVDFSFAQLIATSLRESLPAAPAPSAISYRVGSSAASGGRLLAVWQFKLATGEVLPRVPLALTSELAVAIDLESTYVRAAADSYLS